MDTIIEGVKPTPDSTELVFEFGGPEMSQELTDESTMVESMEPPITVAFTPINKVSKSPEDETVDSSDDQAPERNVSKSSVGQVSESTEVEAAAKTPMVKKGKSSEVKISKSSTKVNDTKSSEGKASKTSTKVKDAKSSDGKASKSSKDKAAKSSEDKSAKDKPAKSKDNNNKVAKSSNETTTMTKPTVRKGPVATNEKPAILESAASKLKRTFSSASLESTTTKDKTKVSDSPGGLGGNSTRPNAEHDPENHEIKRLREEEGLKWGEIAELLNKQRVKAGRVPGLTENAIYSRYMRNAPRIAASNGEIWTPKQVGPKKVGTNVRPLDPLPVFTPQQDELLVKSYKEAIDETWQRVADKMEAKNGKKLDPDHLAKRYKIL